MSRIDPVLATLALGLALALPAPAAERPPAERYPEGAAVPRGLTEEERALLQRQPLRPRLAAAPPAGGTIECPAEYEPMQAILVAWEGQSSWRGVLTMIGREVTTRGNADLVVVVDDAAEQGTASGQLSAGGVDMSRVSFLVASTDSIWMRDYGPRYIYRGGVRAVVDHTYNRPRPNDDILPVAWSAWKRHARYEIPLVHGGGNFHLDALDRGYATRLIANENRSLTEAQIHDLWAAYQGLDTTLFDPYPTSVDATQHLDMWMQVIADDAVMISDWPADIGSIQDQICDQVALDMAGRGYTVHRIPARSVGGTHYTYTNVVMVNDAVLIPSYTNATVAPHNAEALAAWQAALPAKDIRTIAAQPLVTAAGVLHCVVMHVPAPRNGASPAVYLESHRGCGSLTPGDSSDILWISDDDRATTSVDIDLSTDGGRSFSINVVTGAPDSGSFAWTVPSLVTSEARLRITVHDADGNSSSDASPSDFAIGGTTPAAPDDPVPLWAVRASSDVVFTFPGGAASAWSLYEGAIGQFLEAESAACHRDRSDGRLSDNGNGTLSYVWSPPAGDHWYVVSASHCAGESAVAYPPASGACGPTP